MEAQGFICDDAANAGDFLTVSVFPQNEKSDLASKAASRDRQLSLEPHTRPLKSSAEWIKNSCSHQQTRLKRMYSSSRPLSKRLDARDF
jgi:hypothetical protein